MSGRSEISPTRHLTPSELAEQIDKVIQDFESLRTHDQNRIIEGGMISAGSTPSAQITGAGATSWRINVTQLVGVVDNVEITLAATTDTLIHGSTLLLTNGQSAVAAVVLQNVAGTITMTTVKGSAATTGAQVAPTDTQIVAAVGAANSWVKIAETTLNRTGDTTVTQTYANEKRPRWTKEDTASADWSSIAS